MPNVMPTVQVHADATFRVPMPRGGFITTRMAESARERAIDVIVQVSATSEAEARQLLAEAVESIGRAFA